MKATLLRLTHGTNINYHHVLNVVSIVHSSTTRDWTQEVVSFADFLKILLKFTDATQHEIIFLLL